MLQRIDDYIGITQRRNDDGYATGTLYRLVVALGQLTGLFTIVTRDTYNGFVLCFWKGSIGRRNKLRLPIETVSHCIMPQNLRECRA